MPYIERNKVTKEIIGSYENLQRGFAEEFVEETNEELINFVQKSNKMVIMKETIDQKLSRVGVTKEELQIYLGIIVTTTVSSTGVKK